MPTTGSLPTSWLPRAVHVLRSRAAREPCVACSSTSHCTQPLCTAHNRYATLHTVSIADSNESYAVFICCHARRSPVLHTVAVPQPTPTCDQAALVRRPGRAYLSARDREVCVFNFASLVYDFGFSLVSKRKSHSCRDGSLYI